MMIEIPLRSLQEAFARLDVFGLDRINGENRNQTYHRANFHREMLAARRAKDVVIETISLVPQAIFLPANVVHRVRDMNAMLEELARQVLICGIFFRKLERDRHHSQRIMHHPAGAVGLFDANSAWERTRAIEYADVVESE